MATLSSVPARTNLLSLPHELLFEILWEHMDHFAEIKILRLVCKTFKQINTPLMFQHFTLYPHHESVLQLQELTKSTRLASYVEYLVYDDSWRQFLRQSISDIDSALREGMGDETYRAHLQRINGLAINNKSPAGNAELFEALQKIFPLLPNLKDITILEHGATSPYPFKLPVFYSKILGSWISQYAEIILELQASMVGIDPSETGNIGTILFSAHTMANQLKSFDLQTTSIGWLYEESFLGDSCRCIQAFIGLEKLDLWYRRYGLDLDFYHVHRLQILLRQATNLSELTLHMGHVHPEAYLYIYEGCIEYGGNQEDLTSLTFRFPGDPDASAPLERRLAWSNKIRDLTLGGLRCDSRELKEVLKHHSKSLDTLWLQDLLLMPSESDAEGPRSCLVEFIKWLEKYLVLKKVTFSGVMTNFGMQNWYVPLWLRSKLHQEVERFIVGGGVCPLDSVKIPPGYYDFGKREPTSAFSGFVDSGDISGDEGWTMKYYDLSQPPNGTGWPPEMKPENKEEGADAAGVEAS
ncbi:hypothetical protein ES702_02398 [subsurface metagenome]